jgi:fluoride exporter
LKQLLLVFLGGGLGSSLRFAIGKIFHRPVWELPLGTFLVNIIGSFLIGLVFGWALKHNAMHQSTTVFLVAGFCGGFTTFSAFAYENYNFLKNGDYLAFFVYAFGSILLGLLAVFLGLLVTK